VKLEKSGLYFVGLLALAIAGFWPSYFVKFFDGTGDFTFYFHFHAVTALVWIFLLITQPILIAKRKHNLHRSLGRLSFMIIPLLYISIILLAHHQIDPDDTRIGISLWIPFKDLLILGVGYFIAMKYRKNPAIHARGMILTGMVMIEPALVRLLGKSLDGTSLASINYPITIGLVYLLFFTLIFSERRQRIGRWVFPLGLLLYLFVHGVIIFRIKISAWEAFARWFATLPLT